MNDWCTQEPPYLHSLKWRDKESGIEHMTVIRADDVTALFKEVKTVVDKIKKAQNRQDDVPDPEVPQAVIAQEQEPLPEPMGEEDEEVSAFDVPDEIASLSEQKPEKMVYNPNYCAYHEAAMDLSRYPKPLAETDHRVEGKARLNKEGKEVGVYCHGNWCAKHDVPYQLRGKTKDGALEMWWSHQNDNGSYCNGGNA